MAGTRDADYIALEAPRGEEPAPTPGKVSAARLAVVAFMVTAIGAIFVYRGRSSRISSPGGAFLNVTAAYSDSSWETCKTVSTYDHAGCGGDWYMKGKDQCCTEKYAVCEKILTYKSADCAGGDDWGKYTYIGLEADYMGNCCYTSDQKVNGFTCKNILDYQSKYCTGDWKYIGAYEQYKGHCCSNSQLNEKCRKVLSYEHDLCSGHDDWGKWQYFGEPKGGYDGLCCYFSQYTIHETCATIVSYKKNECNGKYLGTPNGGYDGLCCTYS